MTRSIPTFLSILLAILLVYSLTPGCYAQRPFVQRLASEHPSGNSIDDTIWLTVYPAIGSQPSPAVVLVHPLAQTAGGFGWNELQAIAHGLADHGITCVLMTLPYHMQRLPRGTLPLDYFAGANIDTVVETFTQSASDISTVVTWLQKQPTIDPNRIGAIGLSLGAIVVNLAMGQDERLKAGVSLLGGGNLPNLYRNSIVIRTFGHFSPQILTPEALEKLRAIEPDLQNKKNMPRHVLLVGAARDIYVLPGNVTDLWRALGQPPLQWVDSNHFGLMLSERSIVRTSVAYLTRVWNGQPDDPKTLPKITATTIKVGFLTGLDSTITPALQWQFYSLATRADHLSLLHSDLGLTDRGPFLGVAATVNAYIDVGMGERLFGRGVRPYASLHLVF